MSAGARPFKPGDRVTLRDPWDPLWAGERLLGVVGVVANGPIHGDPNYPEGRYFVEFPGDRVVGCFAADLQGAAP